MLPFPVLHENQILVEVEGTSVNYADIKARQGSYHLRLQPPFTPGLEATGRILQTGSRESQFQVGDRVVCFPSTGGYAELTVVEEALTFKIPESIPLEIAAAFPLVMGIAVQLLLYSSYIMPGETLLVHTAAGGVGMAVLQVAQHLNLKNIIATSSNPDKEQAILAHGADHFVLTSSDDYVRTVLDYTMGKGADVILNSIGGQSLHRDLQCLAPFGRLISYGKMARQKYVLNLNTLYTYNRSIIGVSFGHLRKHKPAHVRKVMDKAIEFITSGDIVLPIAKVLPLRDATQAHQYIEDRSLIGKVVLFPGK